MPQQGINNFTFHYAVDGRPTAPPLLVLHGFLGSRQDFAAVLPALAERFYCIVPDLPGHGETIATAGADYGFEAIAQSLLHFIDALNIPQTYLLGYSMGGRLALYMACQFPERFMGVVLESASPGLKMAEERRLRLEKDGAIAHQLRTQPFSQFLSQWYNNPLFASLQHHPKAYAAMLGRRQHNRPLALAKVLQGCSTGKMRSLWEALPTISIPLLLLAGELDCKFVTINQDMLAQTKHKSQVALHQAKHCGHNIHLEAPDEYVQSVVKFCLEEDKKASLT